MSSSSILHYLMDYCTWIMNAWRPWMFTFWWCIDSLSAICESVCIHLPSLNPFLDHSLSKVIEEIVEMMENSPDPGETEEEDEEESGHSSSKSSPSLLEEIRQLSQASNNNMPSYEGKCPKTKVAWRVKHQVTYTKELNENCSNSRSNWDFHWSCGQTPFPKSISCSYNSV